MAETAEDLDSLARVLTACFGKGGDFTVIVEELSGVTSGDGVVQSEAQRKKRKRSGDVPDSARDTEATVQRTEFKVWSSLLAQWSPVFEKMMSSDKYDESQKSQVVITDFSAGAVEIFLRFLYSGSVGGSITALVEVAAIADKYQVEALHPLCLRLVRKALIPEVACEVLAVADRFHVAEMRAVALDLVLTKPKEALQKRPRLRPQLLEEILGSGLLCTKTDELKKTVQSWGGKDGNSLASIINIPANNEHTDDVLNRLNELWCASDRNSNAAFVGNWVSMIVGPGQHKYPADELECIAANGERFTLRKGWMQWVLPHASVHLQGFAFSHTIRATISFRIHVKSDEDGATWHLAYESLEKEIEHGTFLPCKRPQGLVQYFKLEVLEGELPETFFNIQGILQTSV